MNYNDSGNNGNKNSDRYTIGKEETITVTITTLQRVTRNKYKHFSLFPSIHQHLFGDYYKQEKSDSAMLIHCKSFLASKFLFSFPHNKKNSWMLLNNLPNVHEKNVKYMIKCSKCVLITLSVSLIKEPKCQHPSKNYIQFSALIFSAGNKFVPHNPSLNKQTLDSQTQHQLPQYDRPVCEICEPQEEMK